MDRLTNSAPTRRQALALLGAGAAAATLPGLASAQALTFPKGAVIRTVLKDYSPEELANGATLFHEHMSLRPGFLEDWNDEAAQTRTRNARPTVPPPARPAQPPVIGGGATAPFSDEKFMVEEMSIAKREGIGCLVDAGHSDMGRSVDFLRKISLGSGMPIVASAGFYTQPFYPKALTDWSENQIFDAAMKQVHENPTGALGEIGSWDYINKTERKVFRAMGRVQRETGLPLFTHTGIPGKSALEQLDILEDAGADPKHIVIGHLGNLVDANAEIQRAIIRRGAFVGIDRQGGAGDAQVVPMIKGLIDDGYASQLMFSSDLASGREMKQNGGGGYSKTLTVFVPKVRAAGASDAALHQIMNNNPRRFLAFVPKIKRTA
jgi:phosphotriesterase-related protein